MGYLQHGLKGVSPYTQRPEKTIIMLKKRIDLIGTSRQSYFYCHWKDVL
ncbi:MAG: hypothetical protein WBG50_26770 [Desulfomonilaceae bacterium]